MAHAIEGNGWLDTGALSGSFSGPGRFFDTGDTFGEDSKNTLIGNSVGNRIRSKSRGGTFDGDDSFSPLNFIGCRLDTKLGDPNSLLVDLQVVLLP